MFGLVNQDRKTHQKKPLHYDEALAGVARGHSTDMLDNRFFAHDSPTTGDVGRRLLAAKVRVMAGGENIAMNRSVERAEAKLMKSPGHRKNILSDVYTHVGIGIVRASTGVYYVTQVFATPAPKVDLKTAGADIVKQLNQARVARGRLPFKAVPTLHQIASQQAAAMAEAGKKIELDLGALAKAAGVEHKQLSMAHLLTWDPKELLGAAVFFKPRVGRIGVGFAENKKHRKLGYGIIWAVVVFTND